MYSYNLIFYITNFKQSTIIWSVIGVAALAYANSFFIVKIFEPYLKMPARFLMHLNKNFCLKGRVKNDFPFFTRPF